MDPVVHWALAVFVFSHLLHGLMKEETIRLLKTKTMDLLNIVITIFPCIVMGSETQQDSSDIY